MTEEQRALVVLALRIAAEQFARDAMTAPQLKATFATQATDALTLAETIEEADHLEVIA